jgi:hypothetical protein
MMILAFRKRVVRSSCFEEVVIANMTAVTAYISQYNNLRVSTKKPLTLMYAIQFHAPSTSHHALCLGHSTSPDMDDSSSYVYAGRFTTTINDPSSVVWRLLAQKSRSWRIVEDRCWNRSIVYHHKYRQYMYHHPWLNRHEPWWSQVTGKPSRDMAASL